MGFTLHRDVLPVSKIVCKIDLAPELVPIASIVLPVDQMLVLED